MNVAILGSCPQSVKKVEGVGKQPNKDALLSFFTTVLNINRIKPIMTLGGLKNAN